MRPAFLFLGGFKVLCRNRLYLADAERRGLAALLITSAGWRDRTLAALADPDHPAAGIAEAAFVDGQLEVEGSFTAGIVGAVQDLARRWDLRGVYAVGEMMVEQTGLVADALGLPSPGLRATRACRSKYLQRFYCPEWSPPVLLYPPGDRSAPTGEHPGFPAVLKPASRRSSSGVRRVEGQAALDRHLRDYPAAETLLLERYVAGQEYSVEALVQGGRVAMDSVTRKETNEATTASFVELGHTVPAAPGPASDALLAANRAILARLGSPTGSRTPSSGSPRPASFRAGPSGTSPAGGRWPGLLCTPTPTRPSRPRRLRRCGSCRGGATRRPTFTRWCCRTGAIRPGGTPRCWTGSGTPSGRSAGDGDRGGSDDLISALRPVSPSPSHASIARTRTSAHRRSCPRQNQRRADYHGTARA